MKQIIKYNAKQLAKILLDFNLSGIKKAKNQSSPIGNHLKRMTMEDPECPKMGRFIADIASSAQLEHMAAYWTLQKKVHDYQKLNNVSSVYCQEVAWKGKPMRFLYSGDQLDPQPQDLGILAKEKKKTIKKFLNFIEKHRIPMFESISVDNGDDCYDEDILTTPEKLWLKTQNYSYAWLGCGWENVPVYECIETREIAYYQSEWSLNLNKDLSGDSESLTFVGRIRLTV